MQTLVVSSETLKKHLCLQQAYRVDKALGQRVHYDSCYVVLYTTNPRPIMLLRPFCFWDFGLSCQDLLKIKGSELEAVIDGVDAWHRFVKGRIGFIDRLTAL